MSEPIQSPLLKKPDESELCYHRRIVYGKLDDKSLADYDYSELAGYIYGKEYAPDVARRMMYGSCRTLKLLDQERAAKIDDADIIGELESKTRDLRIGAQQYYDQRREYAKLVAHDSRREHLYSVLEKAASELSDSVGDIFGGEKLSEIDFDDTGAVLILSDWHYGMVTDNVFNYYSPMICKERVRRVINETIKKLRLHKCRQLDVVVLGDLIHGAINTSARVASEELVCDQIMQVSEILAQAIEELSQHVLSLHVYITYGNHARTTPSKKDSIHRDNMERIIPWWLEHRLKGHSNITIVPDDGNEFILLSPYGHDIVATHGDLDDVKNSPRLLSVLLGKRYGADIEYVILGDKHHRESFNELGISSVICGSLCGTDEYANTKRLYSIPEQLLLIVDEQHGVDAEYHIRCGD